MGGHGVGVGSLVTEWSVAHISMIASISVMIVGTGEVRGWCYYDVVPGDNAMAALVLVAAAAAAPTLLRHCPPAAAEGNTTTG